MGSTSEATHSPNSFEDGLKFVLQVTGHKDRCELRPRVAAGGRNHIIPDWLSSGAQRGICVSQSRPLMFHPKRSEGSAFPPPKPIRAIAAADIPRDKLINAFVQIRAIRVRISSLNSPSMPSGK